MDNGQSSLVFPMNPETVSIRYMRRLEEEHHRLLAVEGPEPLRCHSELPSFGSMSDHHKEAHRLRICGVLWEEADALSRQFVNTAADNALIGWGYYA